MKARWQKKTLGEVCVVDKAQGIYKQLPYVGLEHIEAHTGRFLGATDPLEVKSSTFKFSPQHLLYGRLRPYLNKVMAPDFVGHCSTEIFPIKPNHELSREFLQYWFLRNETVAQINATCTGARMPRANMNAVLGFEFPLPPLPEQHRIVSILDEAFDGIAIAKANAEKNLQNARALFESHLYSVNAEKASLGDLVKITTGKLDANAAIEGGQYPFFTCSREIFAIDKYAFDCEAILLAGNNAVGDFNVKHYKGKFNAYQRTYVITVNEKKRVLYRFLYFQMLKSLKKFKAQSVGAGTKFLKLGMIQNLEIALPSLAEQQRIVSTMDSVREETQRLESIYRRKLAALDELKQSLLHQAFTGELTKQSPQSVVIPFPTKIPGITTTDLHAGILATAFQLHEKNGKQKYFGHVKAEKIAHMIEAHLGIELGRAPVKDAAGPNDFRHLKGVEHRAKMAKFFDFQRIDGMGYRVTKHRHFEELIERTRGHLGERSRDLDRLLELMLPMNTEQAEVFVTVYAAWNNLLLDKQPITNESIVFEARENWHPNKLNIERRKFFEAIEWMKKHDVIPQGRGKKVNSRV
jgi:type I restriction enzyme S subunit